MPKDIESIKKLKDLSNKAIDLLSNCQNEDNINLIKEIQELLPKIEEFIINDNFGYRIFDISDEDYISE